MSRDEAKSERGEWSGWIFFSAFFFSPPASAYFVLHSSPKVSRNERQYQI